MKKNILRRVPLLFVWILVFTVMLTGCGQPDGNKNENALSSTPQANSAAQNPSYGSANNSGNNSGNSAETGTAVSELYVRFGDAGTPFTMHLYNNETAASIARYVGSADWRLPINHYDDYDNWEVMQYYDIPSRYNIPSNAERVTTEQAGEVYYSEPNRIVLFFGDAEVSGEYTKVGYFDVTENFVSAVENNPVLEGWGNKIILISTDR